MSPQGQLAKFAETTGMRANEKQMTGDFWFTIIEERSGQLLLLTVHELRA